MWPEGVGLGQALQQKHDISFLSIQVHPATCELSTNAGQCLQVVYTSATWTRSFERLDLRSGF